MKDKALADFWFEQYCLAVDFHLKYRRTIVKCLTLAALHINRNKNLLKSSNYKITADYWFEAARNCAIEFEKYSEWKMPKVTRRHFNLK